MKTYISSPSEWVATLKKYHLELYRAPEQNDQQLKDKCPPFFTVYRGYNEMAWLLQHRSHFTDAEEFANCLKDHHVSPNNVA